MQDRILPFQGSQPDPARTGRGGSQALPGLHCAWDLLRDPPAAGLPHSQVQSEVREIKAWSQCPSAGPDGCAMTAAQRDVDSVDRRGRYWVAGGPHWLSREGLMRRLGTVLTFPSILFVAVFGGTVLECLKLSSWSNTDWKAPVLVCSPPPGWTPSSGVGGDHLTSAPLRRQKGWKGGTGVRFGRAWGWQGGQVHWGGGEGGARGLQPAKMFLCKAQFCSAVVPCRFLTCLLADITIAWESILRNWKIQ